MKFRKNLTALPSEANTGKNINVQTVHVNTSLIPSTKPTQTPLALLDILIAFRWGDKTIHSDI